MVLMLQVMVFAQTSPVASPSASPVVQQDINPLVDQIFSNIASGKWVMAASAFVLLLVYLFRRYLQPKLNLGSGILPWISIVLGVLVGVASGTLGGLPVAEAIKIAILSGPSASTIWSAILKNILHKDA